MMAEHPAGNDRLKLMVSSTVYGIEAVLDQTYALLTGFGYDVWMSRQGTIPVLPNQHAFESLNSQGGSVIVGWDDQTESGTPDARRLAAALQGYLREEITPPILFSLSALPGDQSGYLPRMTDSGLSGVLVFWYPIASSGIFRADPQGARICKSVLQTCEV